MRWRLAVARAWGLPAVWVAGDEEPAPVQAAVVHVIHHVHHYLPAPGGQAVDVPQPRAAVTSSGENREAVNP